MLHAALYALGGAALRWRCNANMHAGNDTQGGSNYNPTTAPLPAPPTPISTGPLASFLEAEREYRAQGTVVPEASWSSACWIGTHGTVL